MRKINLELPKWGITLFFILTLNLGSLFAQDIVTAEKYLEMVSNQYSSIKDYEAKITIRSGGSEMTGTVSHLAPSFLRIDFTRPANQVIVFNGEMLTIYLPELNAVLNQEINKRTSASGAGMATGNGLSLLRRNYVPSFVTGPNPELLDNTSSERVVKLRLSRRSVSEGFREIVLSINPDTKLIRRIEGRTIAEGEMRFDFTDIRTNQGVPEMRFVYDAPASANTYNNFLFRDSD